MTYGIVSDVHGNLTALEAVLERLKGVDKLVCPGDVVGYGPDPAECISRLRGLNAVIVLGNHDAAVCGKLDLSWFNPFACEAVQWTREQLSESDIKWLSTIPLVCNLDDSVVVHSSLAQPETFPYISTASDARMCFEKMEGQRICLVGHSHVAAVFIQQEGQYHVDCIPMPQGGKVLLESNYRFIINCGSVGQPRDGNPDAACVLIDTDAMSAEIIRVPYDVSDVQRRMRKAHLPRMLIQRLTYGM